MADTGEYHSGVEVLTAQAEGKPEGWLDAAKQLKAPAKIKEARSKVMTKAQNSKYLEKSLTVARATNETSQKLPGAISTFIGSKKAMAILVDHETRLSSAEKDIAILKAEVAILKGEPRDAVILRMLSEGFTKQEIADSLKVSRMTVHRAAAKLINPEVPDVE